MRGPSRFSSTTEMETCCSRAPRITRPPFGMRVTASAWARTRATTELCGAVMFPVSVAGAVDVVRFVYFSVSGKEVLGFGAGAFGEF